MSAYRFAGLPLTPSVAGELALELAPGGQAISRADLVRLVTNHHAEQGGLAPRSSPAMTMKKSLADLQRTGRAEQLPVRGYWRIRPDAAAPTNDAPVERGKGSQAVYAYFFPAYRDQAAYLGRDEWPMKIGMTANGEDAWLRVRDQCGTAMPERPVIGLIYRTDNARTAERTLHGILVERGRKMQDSPGTEWFLTNLSEIGGILDFVTGHAN